MTQFDILLRRALMDANLAQYQRAFQRVEANEPDFSPGYLRERTRLLADPLGWERQSKSGRRLNWRLIVLIAALLLLSACAYVVATGQFSQWFPQRGVDPQAPDVSEEVLSRTGTEIGQSQTIGDETMTLNAAIWDGSSVWLSLSFESPNIPEEIQRYTPLYTSDCYIRLRQDQWEESKRNSLEQFYANSNPAMSPEEVEAAVRAELDKGDQSHDAMLTVLEREGNTLILEAGESVFADLFTETTRPELTVHLENIATYVDGGVDENGYAQYPLPGLGILKGPFDFTFTLSEPILPIRYEGADLETAVMDVPLRFTGFQLSATKLTAFYEALRPVELPQPGQTLTPEEMSRIDQAMRDTLDAAFGSVQGFWTEDGKYVDLTNADNSGGSNSVSRTYPYPIDPAIVTAVDVAGTRVELGGLARMEG